MPKPKFKPYDQSQQYLLPPSLEDMIKENHPVRVVNNIIDKIDLGPLEAQYKGGGTSSYNPKMLLKVIVYGYLRNVYSSRKLEEMTNENIHMMWISGMNKPDHNTINRFRIERLNKVLKEIFTQIVMLLVEAGQLSIKEIYTDGTKIEANANKYTFVWGKSVKKNKERIKQQLKDLWTYTQEVAKEESEEEEQEDFEEINPEKIDQTVEKIDNILKGKKVDKKVKQKLSAAKRDWAKRLQKYQNQEEILENRNSYSKTDEDATFMRMKDDPMQNRDMKPGYNLQISSNNQYIVNYSIEQTNNDLTTMIPHLEEYQEKYDQVPEVIVADAGYGSEENYQYMEDNQIEGYVKYNNYYKEQKNPRVDKKPFTEDKLHYNPKEDCYYCPMGQKMRKVSESIKKTANNYERKISKYQAVNCNGCPVRGVCHNQKSERKISVSHKGKLLREKAKEKLKSERGEYYLRRRPIEAEVVFGNIKQNKTFKRFYLRGKQKVKTEFGLIAIAHNLNKYAMTLLG